MALTVETGRAADLGWNKLIFVASGGTLIDLSNSVGDAQIDSEVTTETYSVYGTPNDKTVSTAVAYPLNINTMYASPQASVFQDWLEGATPFYWAELVDVADANSHLASKGTFALGSYHAEGVTLGAAPTDGLIEMGLSTVPEGSSFEGVAYPFTATAAGNLDLVGTVDLVAASERIWVLLTEVNGVAVTLTATVGVAGDSVDVDETKADIYELPKRAANNTGSLTVALAATSGVSQSSPVTGYVLVGRSVTEISN